MGTQQIDELERLVAFGGRHKGLGAGTAGGCHGAEPAEAICNWEELAELERHGLRVQSHGVTHRPFSELDPAGRADELRQSKTALETRLGTPVTLFAYPYGVIGSDEAALQRAGYRGACLYGGEPVRGRPIPERYRLPRVAMGPDTDLSSALG